MQLDEVVWKEVFAEKIESKHAVSMDEVEQILFGSSLFRRVEKGRIRGEDLYVAYGQTIDRAISGSLLRVEATDYRIACFGSQYDQCRAEVL